MGETICFHHMQQMKKRGNIRKAPHMKVRTAQAQLPVLALVPIAVMLA